MPRAIAIAGMGLVVACGVIALIMLQQVEPDVRLEDIPIYTRAQLITPVDSKGEYENNGDTGSTYWYGTSFVTRDKSPAVLTYYKDWLTKHGWTLQASNNSTTNSAVFVKVQHKLPQFEGTMIHVPYLSIPGSNWNRVGTSTY